MQIEDTKKIKVISSNEHETCSFGCQIPYGGQFFEHNVNHYLQEHRYKLLHVGQESAQDNDGNPYHSTVAVLSALA